MRIIKCKKCGFSKTITSKEIDEMQSNSLLTTAPMPILRPFIFDLIGLLVKRKKYRCPKCRANDWKV